MSISRSFAIVAVIGFIAAAALTVRAAVTTSPVAASAATERENITERSLELHNQQPDASRSTVADTATQRENIAERSLELHDRNKAVGNSTAASSVSTRENITERTLELQDQLAQVRAATAQFHQTDAAYAAGYTLVPGSDYCFNNPGVDGMGIHLIKTSSFDLTIDALQPEAMVYQPGPNGQLQLVAVEYIVPAAQWDAAGNTQLPSVLGQSFHLNSALGVYVLHAWIWKDNPSGMFQDWNPKVSCR